MGDFRVRLGSRIFLVLFFTLIGAALSTGPGTCPIYPNLPNFDIRKMSGIWYEVERSFYLVEITTSCTAINVTINQRGYMAIRINTVNRWTGNPTTVNGVGIPSHNGSSMFRYKLNNRMPYVIGRMLPGAGYYHVLFTDYDRFAIVWSCNSVSVAHSDRIWVIARNREIPALLRAQIYGIMTELRLDPDRLILAKNQNCTAYT